VGWFGISGALFVCCGDRLGVLDLEEVGFVEAGVVRRGLIMSSHCPFEAMGKSSLLGVLQV